MLAPGLQPIPGHVLKRSLGAGAFGEVWEAIDGDGNARALKFIDCRTVSRSLISSEVRVFRALSELRHPHIIQLYGIHASSRYLILSMERADGNLADLRQAYREETRGNIPPEHALELLDQAASALDFLAGLNLPAINSGPRGLQHCDVKPSNLLLLGDQIKVADFGLCAGTSWHAGKGWRGTPPFAAPELYNGNATLGTDQFALAVTFCDLVIGERVFWKHVPGSAAPSGPPIDFTKLRERELAVLARALHPHPSARWSSCRAFLTALREVVLRPRDPGMGLAGPSLVRFGT